MISTAVYIDIDLPPLLDMDTVKLGIRKVVFKTSKEFAEHIRVSMVNSKPRGKRYKLKSGPGFKRFHKASRKGQRPAVWTGNLINAIQQKMVADNRAVVDFAPTPNPRNKKPADQYAAILQFDMGRIVHGKGDVKKFQARQRTLLIEMRDNLAV